MGKNSHSFCIVEESDDSKSVFLYDTISQGISEGSAIILAAESQTDEIIDILEKRGLDARGYISRGILTILDKEFVYSVKETGLDSEQLLERWFSLISDVRNKSECQGILAIGTSRVFLETRNLEKLMAYEGSIGRTFEYGFPINAVCCFDADAFSKLGLANIIHFLNYHEYTIYQGGVYLQWHPHMVLTIINRAIDNALGPGTSNLLLKTLQLIYGFDDGQIMSQPGQFEEKLKKVLGKTADMVLDKIQKEIASELSYLRRSDVGDNKSTVRSDE